MKGPQRSPTASHLQWITMPTSRKGDDGTRQPQYPLLTPGGLCGEQGDFCPVPEKAFPCPADTCA
eukprot:2632009-Lingulodinium_polyedra.AAC.1